MFVTYYVVSIKIQEDTMNEQENKGTFVENNPEAVQDVDLARSLAKATDTFETELRQFAEDAKLAIELGKPATAKELVKEMRKTKEKINKRFDSIVSINKEIDQIMNDEKPEPSEAE